jgi:hypothetical protein
MTRRLGPPFLLLAIVIGFFWKLTLSSHFTWLENPDVAYQVVPWQQVQAEAFHKGKLPLWDPYLWGGQSLIGQMQPGSAYPLNWILYALPFRNGHIGFGYLKWYWVLIHWMAALFAYWLCRDLGRSHAASCIAGVAFALAGAIGTTMWPQKLNGMIWIPLVLLFFFRAVDGGRPLLSSALSGFALGMSWLAGHHEIPLYVSLTVVGLWILYFFRDKQLQWNVLRLAGVWVVFLALTSALQVLPAYEYGREARRWVGLPDPLEWRQTVPFTVHQEYSFGLSNVFGLIVPGFHGFTDPYAGPVILSLAALAVALCWSDLRVRILSVVALAGFFFSLGYQNVLYGVAYSLVPMIEKAREPAMAILLLNVGVAILAAYGFDAMRSQQQSVWLRRIAIGVAAVGALMLAILLGVIMSRQPRPWYDDRAVMVAILALLAAALYLGYRKQAVSAAALSACCLLLVLMDLGNATGYYYVHDLDKEHAIYLRRFSENQDILAWLRSQPTPFRIQTDNQEIPFNFGDWYGLEVFNGYVASLPSRLLRLGQDTPRTRMLFGTKYWIAREPRTPDQVEVFTGESGLKVYQSPSAMPRVWSVHQATNVSSAKELVPAFEDPELDLRTTALFLGQTPQLSACGGDKVVLARSEFDDVVIDASMQCRGMVILSDNYDSGWSATVDGRPARIWDAYTVVRGVEVEAGRHHIEMHYSPWSVKLGAAGLGLSLLGLLALAYGEPKTRKLPLPGRDTL